MQAIRNNCNLNKQLYQRTFSSGSSPVQNSNIAHSLVSAANSDPNRKRKLPNDAAHVPQRVRTNETCRPAPPKTYRNDSAVPVRVYGNVQSRSTNPASVQPSVDLAEDLSLSGDENANLLAHVVEHENQARRRIAHGTATSDAAQPNGALAANEGDQPAADPAGARADAVQVAEMADAPAGERQPDPRPVAEAAGSNNRQGAQATGYGTNRQNAENPTSPEAPSNQVQQEGMALGEFGQYLQMLPAKVTQGSNRIPNNAGTPIANVQAQLNFKVMSNGHILFLENWKLVYEKEPGVQENICTTAFDHVQVTAKIDDALGLFRGAVI